ncbi:heavy metal translocating P-type ATPase metal-binding domain-containing protein [Capnocytophaga sp.]|uniref:heavy metal translocating P-type ATPase n=1 Tax=Capnocytophaga sp. TaxID=44737 RepID=UPI0026DB76EF|nr:heavy metal translocating P-type ATPase metal-binding domain-containing protein [Capnocytophaga sp.]MDO5104319.1 heavy metal translocating P-type ATPase metal-binding domain-containing protein [Capnocytophaga sp.]
MIKTCYHCGNDCDSQPFVVDDKDFCCLGCKTVYEILSENNLTSYYDIAQNPGARPEEALEKFSFLENEKIVEKLLEFNDGNVQIVNLYIPHIHCSSCIWVLENLDRLHSGVGGALVNFPEKTVRITYNSEKISLKELVVLLANIGYAPYISLEDYQGKKNRPNRQIYYKLGVAAFAFGNVMLLSFPEYFETEEFWFEQYKSFFRWIMFVLSLPVMFYSASDYFISAYKGIKNRILNIDIPLALGILAMFVRSCYDILTDAGQGFFDSLNSLVFLLLIGKFFQQRTYNFLSFERDYKSYFPIGITKILPGRKEESVQVYDIKPGDRLLIRNQELIPVDAVLIRGEANIDYSFVTGEANPVQKNSGDKLFAGGKQTQGAIEVEALKEISQSYLTQLWSNEIFSKDKDDRFKTLTDKVSRRFTIVILVVAFVSLLVWILRAYWGLSEPVMAMNVFTAVLIIACPCALAISAPFTLGNMLRIFGRRKLYLKNSKVIEKMAKIDTIIFDKTGTITTANKSDLTYEGDLLSAEEQCIVKNTLRNSNHPLSRQIYDYLQDATKSVAVLDFKEITGKGIESQADGVRVKIGSAAFVGKQTDAKNLKTSVHIALGGVYKGCFVLHNSYRKGISELFASLATKYQLVVLSGDNESERLTLEKLLPANSQILFNQKPDDKLHYVHSLQQKGKKVMMVGDGLNDAGALKQSDVGLALAENVNVFSPACDGIMDSTKIKDLKTFLALSEKAIRIIKSSFVLSFLYNIVGISFAVLGQLSPLVAAILMPLSSISIVLFTTLSVNWAARRLQ